MPLVPTQTIEFSSGEDDISVEVIAKDVTVTSSSGKHPNGSSKVKLNNIIDYNWEEKFYHGQLLTVQNLAKYIAYAIKAVTKPNTSMIRIINRQTSKRGLIKDLGIIEDLSFADIVDDVLLASVDHNGTVLVHSISEVNEEIMCTLILHIKESGNVPSGVPHRIFWCSYISEFDPPNWNIDQFYEEITRLLAVTRNNRIELWNVKTVRENHGNGPFKANDVSNGFIEIDAHSALITDASFSPDGSAIATASLDGQCKFYQVYRHSESPRCLHHWEPHGRKPLSSLFFLDDHRNFTPCVQFWKYAITGADNNTELKLWSCQTWNCIQTIRILPKYVTAGPLKLKAQMDAEAGFLLLSDVVHRVLYVLQIKKPESQTLPYICSLTEFKLTYPILSFGIVDAQVRSFKTSSFSLEEICTDVEEESIPAIVIRMYLVQPKSLQECYIVFQPAPVTIEPNPIPLTEDDEEEQMDEVFNEIPNNLPPAIDMNHKEMDSLNTLPVSLMTPDAFTSPAKHVSSTEKGEPELNMKSSLNSSKELTSFDDPLFVGGVTGTVGGGLLTSGGSSPSREVQEILSVKESSVSDFYLDTPELKPESTTWPKTSPLVTSKSGPTLQGDKIDFQLDLARAVNVEVSVNSLREEISTLHCVIQQQGKILQELTQELKRRDDMIPGRMDAAIQNWWETHRSSIKSEIGAPKCTIDQDQLSAQLSRAIQSSFATLVAQDLKKTVTRSLETTISTLGNSVEAELIRKVSTTDQILKDTLNKMFKNKTFIDGLTTTLQSYVAPAIQQCYNDSFTQAVPVFNKQCEKMFEQISVAFTNGTTEYIKEMETFCDQIASTNKEEKVLLSETVEKVSTAAQQLVSNIEKSGKSLEDNLTQAVTRAIRGSMNNGTIVPRSRTVTPAPSLIDSQVLLANISSHIAQGQFDTAFQQALSAADLTMVMYVCEKVPPHIVFTGTGSLLSQCVLLSLIQQLSSDITSYSETKHRYLEEAVMNLDRNNTATREHMPAVLTALHKNLQAYSQAHPTSTMNRRVRMLQMAVQSLLS